MDAFIKRMIAKAQAERSDIAMEFTLPEQLPATKITIEVAGKEPVVLENAAGFVVYADLGGNQILGYSAGHVKFLFGVLKMFEEKLVDLIQGKIPKPFSVYPGGKR